MAAAAAPHVGQDSLDDGDAADDIDVELAAQIVHAGLLDGALQAVASVADQHVDRADVLLDAVDQGGDGGVVGDVQQRACGPAGGEGFELSDLPRLANGTDNAVPGGQGRLGEGAAEAAADAGDEERLSHGGLLCDE